MRLQRAKLGEISIESDVRKAREKKEEYESTSSGRSIRVASLSQQLQLYGYAVPERTRQSMASKRLPTFSKTTAFLRDAKVNTHS
jgi:N-acetyl-anhydromuramyl-L-alanine amidase AmpD